MSALLPTRTSVGVRSLSGFTAAAAPGRLLDLHAVSLERPHGEGYRERPLFAHPILNRAIVAKNAARPGEAGPKQRAGGLGAPFDITKLIFPFDPVDLDLGGQALVAGLKGFPETLAELLDYDDLSLRRDLAVVALLDRLPSLDPFLVREALHQRGFDVAPCYFRFRPPEEGDMLDFVAAELSALVGLCFGEAARKDHKRARRISTLILCDQTSPELSPLREALRMDEAEFAEAVFAWKGFLYYRWKVRRLGPDVRAARRGIAMIRLQGYGDDATQLIRRAKAAIDKSVVSMCVEVRDTLRLYDRAYKILTVEQRPEGFRTFLDAGTALFVDLGVRVGRLEQLCEFWSLRFSPRRAGGLSADNLLDALRDVLQEMQLRPADVVMGSGEVVVWEDRTIRAVVR